MLCTKFGRNWPSGSWEEVENVKHVKRLQTDRQTDGQTDAEKGSEKLSFQFRWAKNVSYDAVYFLIFNDASL